MDLEKKTKKELIEEIERLRVEKQVSHSSFPGLAVITKYERFISQRGEKYQYFFDKNPLPMWVIDNKNLEFIVVNDAAIKHYGYSREEFLLLNMKKILNKENFRNYKNCKNNQEKQTENSTQWKHFTKNQTIIEVEVFEVDLIVGGREARLVLIKDVTEHLLARKTIEQSEEDYKNLIKYSPDGVFIHDERGWVVFVNISGCKMVGIKSLAEVKNKSIFEYITPEYHHVIRAQKENLKKGDRYPFINVKVKRPDNKIIEVELKPVSFVFKGKKATLTVVHDITFQRKLELERLRAQIAEEANKTLLEEIAERKKVENELRISKDRHKAIFNQAYIGIAQENIEGRFLNVNDQVCEIMGYSKEELYKKTFLDITHNDDLTKSRACLRTFFNGEVERATLEKRFIHKNGSIIYANVTMALVKDSQGKASYFVSVFEDITEKKRAQEQIINQTAKISAIFHNSSHLICTINKKFILTSFNENFANLSEAIFGIRPVLNLNLLKLYEEIPLIFKKKDFDYAVNIHKEALKGISHKSENMVMDSKQNVFWFETYLDPVLLPDGSIEEISYISHDITEKKITEKQIIQSLKEKEVLLKEVHHRVKNNLQVVSSILNLQSSYVKDINTLNILKESQNRIKTMAFIHEGLYQTKDFSSIKFSEYVEKLAQNIMSSYMAPNKNIKLRLDVEDVFLNLDLAITCGLIINELASNSLKHGFSGKRKEGELFIGLCKKNEQVTLVLSDDGLGFSEKVDYMNTDTLGLQLVMTLVEQIDGDIKLEKTPLTKYTIIFNLKENKNVKN